MKVAMILMMMKAKEVSKKNFNSNLHSHLKLNFNYMPISQTTSGTYIGYTLGDGTPTLYFEGGRYTQVHTNPENVGWHPIVGDHYQANISAATRDSFRILDTDTEEEIEAKQAIKADLVDQLVDGTLVESPDPNGKLLEVSVVGGVDIPHVSRGRLIRVGDPAFDPTYDAHYARSVLTDGYVAQNSRDRLLRPLERVQDQIQNELDAAIEDGLTPSAEFEAAFDDLVQSYQAARDAVSTGDFEGASKILADASTRLQTTLHEQVDAMNANELGLLTDSVNLLDQVANNSKCISDDDAAGYEADDEGGDDSDPDDDDDGAHPEEEL